MAKTIETSRQYHSKEEEAIRKMKERCTQELEEREVVDTEESNPTEDSQMGQTKESQEQEEEEESTKPPPKKRKKQKKDKPKSVKEMSKKEQKRKAGERKALRKERVLEKKKAKEEAEKENARLKREEHKMLLEKTHTLLQKNTPAAAARSATATATSAEIHSAPPRAESTEDPLETSLVESGPLFISLNPFEGDQPIIRPTLGACPGAAAILTETIHVESSTERLLEATGGAPKKSTGGKAPQKQAIPKKSRKTPGSGALRYIPKAKHIREARKAGGLYPDDPDKGKKNRF